MFSGTHLCKHVDHANPSSLLKVLNLPDFMQARTDSGRRDIKESIVRPDSSRRTTTSHEGSYSAYNG